MASDSSSSPIVTHDPRFMAGRKLIERGMADEGAVDIFATLLEETTQKYGQASVESSPAYYEYGNVLLRAAMKQQQQQVEEEEEEEEEEGDVEDDQKRRQAAAEAAERRNQGASTTTKPEHNGDEDKKPAAVKSGAETEKSEEKEEKEEQDEEIPEDDSDDVDLALEMMENAYSILDVYNESDNDKKYTAWVKDQIPRVLLGIGDTLSRLQRHADAADAYSRALELRQALQQEFATEDYTIQHLVAHRKVVEATVLIAEELLACSSDADVVTTETQSLIVKKEERISYATGYYDKARDALQEAVFFMGQLAARNIDLGREKEDVCFLATMVMGVGESLAAIEEEEAAAAAAESTEPVKKKAKH